MSVTQVSLVALSIPAFPGSAWCTSVGERMRYLRKRLFPGPEQIAARQLTATEQWAVRLPWSHLSQRRRMLQWLVNRPPRQAPMYIVQEVLRAGS